MSSSEFPINRYLWAADPAASQIPPGELIQGRYEVIAPQIWRDTQPDRPPYVPQALPDEVFPYLRLYPQRLHVPEVFGLAVLGDEPATAEVILLENVPIDEDGDLYPAIEGAWSEASAVRQVYWLWQILQLWQPLSEQGVALSLLIPENIRVQGWRVWLLELYGQAIALGEGESVTIDAGSPPTLQHLGQYWLEWTAAAQAPVTDRLQAICQQMCRGEGDLQAIAAQLDRLLLEQAAQHPLRIYVAGASDTGPQRSSNEDACYPTASDLANSASPPNDRLIPYLTLVCDGIGGHEGGEVASQLALQNLKQLVRALLVEVAEQTEPATPDTRTKQLEEIVRVVNNLIDTRNNLQGRESRQRMGTTLVMALQLPQRLLMPNGSEVGTAHELYIITVGDSRAYWITSDYCQQLTVDDDVAAREVRLGRSLYREALKRPDAGALTQALGTREAELVHPMIQRFIIEEDGLLLLCSDGLSDNGLVEKSWRQYAKPVLKDKMTGEAAVQSWIELANQQNGHDNTSAILSAYRLSPEPPALFTPKQGETEFQTATTSRVESELTDASRALLYDRAVPRQSPETITVESRRPRPAWLTVLGVLAVLLLLGVTGYAAWLTFTPQESQPPQQESPES